MDEPTSALSAGRGARASSASSATSSRAASRSSTSRTSSRSCSQVGDRITVLRDGRIVASADAADIDVPWIIEQMVGRSPASLFTRTEHQRGEVLLRVDGRHAAARSAAATCSTTSRSSSTPARSWASTGSWAPVAPSSWRCWPGVRPEATGEVWLGERPLRAAAASPIASMRASCWCPRTARRTASCPRSRSPTTWCWRACAATSPRFCLSRAARSAAPWTA